MNKEWSELNKIMQVQLKKKDTFKEELSREDFNSIPFINADGYHSKTIAYSIWHIFRIEDIVVHTVINEDEQVFFAGNYQERINSPIITTGNELIQQQITHSFIGSYIRKGKAATFPFHFIFVHCPSTIRL